MPGREIEVDVCHPVLQDGGRPEGCVEGPAAGPRGWWPPRPVLHCGGVCDGEGVTVAAPDRGHPCRRGTCNVLSQDERGVQELSGGAVERGHRQPLAGDGLGQDWDGGQGRGPDDVAAGGHAQGPGPGKALLGVRSTFQIAARVGVGVGVARMAWLGGGVQGWWKDQVERVPAALCPLQILFPLHGLVHHHHGAVDHQVAPQQRAELGARERLGQADVRNHVLGQILGQPIADAPELVHIDQHHHHQGVQRGEGHIPAGLGAHVPNDLCH
mmetsp:Transcript_65471/g.116512  ORF Transcript_65471/g.116512 Transcript_65471/m.116512 type:complete len:270 (-) Transcript_65471:923-1732(-)